MSDAGPPGGGRAGQAPAIQQRTEPAPGAEGAPATPPGDKTVRPPLLHVELTLPRRWLRAGLFVRGATVLLRGLAEVTDL